jgi:hypothetical protein
MVERFNGYIAYAFKINLFNNVDNMAQALVRYIVLYNNQLPQSALKGKTLI